MKPISFRVLIVLQLVLPATLAAESSVFPQTWFNKLSLKFVTPPANVAHLLPADINHDGVDEYVLIENGVGINLYRSDRSEFIGIIPIKNLAACITIGHSADHSQEIILTLRDSLQLHLVSVTLTSQNDLSEYRAVFDTIFTEPYAAPDQRLIGSPCIAASLDANHDGDRDYIACRAYGIEENCRSVMLIDGATQREVWSRRLGPLPQEIMIANLDGSGEREIVISSCATGNSLTADGYSDSSSYLFALTLDGRDFWPPLEIGGELSRPDMELIADANGTDTNIVVTVRGAKNSDSTMSICIISGRNGKTLHEFSQPGGFRLPHVVQLDGTATNSILAVTDSGSMMVFDDSLHALKDLIFTDPVLNIFPPIDVTGDSVAEIPVTTIDNTLWILDKSLSKLLKRQLRNVAGGFATVAGSPSDGIEVICAGDRAYIMVFFWENKSFAEIVPPVVQIAVLLTSLTALLIGYLQIRHRRSYFEFLDSVFNDSSRAIIAIDSGGKFNRSNSVADRLFDAKQLLVGHSAQALAQHPALSPLHAIVESFLASSSEKLDTEIRIIVDNKTREFAVNICRGAKRASHSTRVTIIMLQDITELSQARLYSAWSQVASGLAHDLRKPLAPLKLLLQDLIARIRNSEISIDSVIDKHLSPSMTQVNRMAKYIDQLAAAANSKDAPREKLCVDQFFQDILKITAATDGQFPPIKLAIGTDLPNLTANRGDFERIIFELFENAVTATQNCPNPEIAVNVHRSERQPGHLCIEVKDNGCGIVPEILPHVFEPYVTTGTGTHRGIGLWTTRKIITEHGGTIEVHSKCGVGTVFVIELPGRPQGE